MHSPYLFCSLLSFTSLAIAQSLSAQNATVAALVYGYPLLSFQKLVNNVTAPSSAGVNNFQHARALATAADTTIVAPNTDTLYSQLLYDLSQGDLVITVPDVPQDQFHLNAYYDPFGDNYALTGSANLNSPGQYRIRPRPEGGANGVDTSDVGSYQAYINSPTAYGILLIRWLVNATNLDAIHTYQDGTTAQNVTRGQPSSIPSLLEVAGAINSTAAKASTPPTPAQEALGLLAAYSAQNPPESSAQIPLIDSALNFTVDDILSAAGISNGTYTPPASVDLDAANSTAVTAIGASIMIPGATQSLSNGWGMLTPSLTGDYGVHYAIRAYIAKAGYLQLKAPNAIYPEWRNSSASSGSATNGTQLLPANSAFLYTFVGGKPPLKSVGFWSLTAYSASSYLIPNPIGVYSRGDRSNMTYPDGSLIYGAQGNTNSSSGGGTFQILVQAADVPPPANWTSNWLPGPAGGGELQLLLRFYDATDEVLNGGYEMPQVQLVDAITNGTVGSGSSSESTAVRGQTNVVSLTLMILGVVVIGSW